MLINIWGTVSGRNSVWGVEEAQLIISWELIKPARWLIPGVIHKYVHLRGCLLEEPNDRDTHRLIRGHAYSRFKGRPLPLSTKMSRFFATGDTDTESSSESSDDEPRLVGGAKGTTGAAIGAKYVRASTHVVGQGALNRSMCHCRQLSAWFSVDLHPKILHECIVYTHSLYNRPATIYRSEHVPCSVAVHGIWWVEDIWMPSLGNWDSGFMETYMSMCSVGISKALPVLYCSYSTVLSHGTVQTFYSAVGQYGLWTNRNRACTCGKWHA